VRNVSAVGNDRNLVALTGKALLVIDAEKGSIAHTLEGFGEPYFPVERRNPSPAD